MEFTIFKFTTLSLMNVISEWCLLLYVVKFFEGYGIHFLI